MKSLLYILPKDNKAKYESMFQSLSLIFIVWVLTPLYASNLLGQGTPAKKFYLMSLTGKRQGYKNYFQNQTEQDPKATIISFWATSCIPCRKEMPELIKFTQEHPEFRLVFINLNKKSERQLVQKFIQRFKIEGTHLLDVYQTAGKNYGVCQGTTCQVPALFVIDSQGQILLSQSGYDPEEVSLKESILAALPQQSTSPQTLEQ